MNKSVCYPVYPEEFYDWRNGVPVDNETINNWIRKDIDKLSESNNDFDAISTSSGNTKVTVFKLKDRYSIDVSVGYLDYNSEDM